MKTVLSFPTSLFRTLVAIVKKRRNGRHPTPNLPGTPWWRSDPSKVTEISFILRVLRSYQNMSGTPLVSPGTRFVALDSRTTYLPL